MQLSITKETYVKTFQVHYPAVSEHSIWSTDFPLFTDPDRKGHLPPTFKMNVFWERSVLTISIFKSINWWTF